MEANPVFCFCFLLLLQIWKMEHSTPKYRWLNKEAHFLQDFERVISLLQELMFLVQDTQNIPTVLNPALGQRQSWGTYILKAATAPITVCSYWRSHSWVRGQQLPCCVGSSLGVLIRCVYLNTKVKESSSWYSGHTESFAQCH